MSEMSRSLGLILNVLRSNTKDRKWIIRLTYNRACYGLRALELSSDLFQADDLQTSCTNPGVSYKGANKV